MSDDFETYEDGFEQEPAKNNKPLIIGIVVLVVLCCCCSVAGFGWYYGDTIVDAINNLGHQLPAFLTL